ncbi:MAG: hypothetical protein NTV32_06205 [Gammaproteobacteria bacterium]|nr:hypothetical protein [Gammaproteobacteria bacterium]
MKSILRGLTALFVLLNLTACSQIPQLSGNNNPFRNREMDYTTHPVMNQYPLAIPPGVTAPTLEPTFIIPPGPNFYLAGPATPITPPGFSDVYLVPKLPVKYQDANS